MGIRHSSSRKKSCNTSKDNKNGEVTFDDFQVLRAIGKGSFGKVCLVRKRGTHQMYAMKYVKKNQCIEKAAFPNVLREIKILASLQHPFLVNLWFTFQDEEDMFMVFDLLLGGDLRYHIHQDGRFTESRVRLYVCEISLALDYLQSKGILHRDIKPENILLDETGHVHITDFNIATVLQRGDLATSLSGTKPYIAPEVFDCVLDLCTGYSFSADWWSLGVCAYEMLCGQRPYDIHSSTPLEDIREMFQAPPPVLPKDVPSQMADLIFQLLNVDACYRISSLDQIKSHPYLESVDFVTIFNMEVKPSFVPNKDQLNCDPTFELEEMILETQPLHKKQKRLSRQIPRREHNSSGCAEDTDIFQQCLDTIEEHFIVYNKEREMQKDEKEDDTLKSNLKEIQNTDSEQ